MNQFDANRNAEMLCGTLAKRGYVRWWHSFSGVQPDSGEIRTFFVEYFIVNPSLGGTQPILAQHPYFRKRNMKPSYVMIKAGVFPDENGEGVFFKNKLGSGTVYFLTLPLEKYLGEKQGAFFKDNLPDYSVIYRELANNAKFERTADCDNKYIRFTEHIIDENSRYVLAINYNNKPESAKLKLNDGYDAEVIFGNGFSDDVMNIEQNDGILFKITKKN